MTYRAIIALVLVCFQVAQGAQWAVLVAGSNGYDNYRHQADVLHAYHLLIKRGIPKGNIVTMVYDDIAFNRRNPIKGNIINVPNGPNLYPGVWIDYKGDAVNKDTFLKVLNGDYHGVKGRGSNKVLFSNANDHVFVYYADHGNKGLIAFPSGGALFTRELLGAIDSMYNNRKYKKLVFYIEACFSGSMFYRRLPTDKNVYAITAANERESSWSCYYDQLRKTALADDFSIKWMQDSETHNLHSRSLNQQFYAVRAGVDMSHVCQFGDTRGIGNMAVSNFQGDAMALYSNFSSPIVPVGKLIKSWDVPYMSLVYQLEDAKTPEERMEILQKLQVEEEAKFMVHESMKSIVGKIVKDPSIFMAPQKTATTEEQDHCYEQAVVKFDEACTQFSKYDHYKRDLHIFANLCSKGEPIESIYAAIDDVCSA